MQVTNIHRYSNGTVDVDVYRRKAFLLRRETRNKILRRFGRPARPLHGAISGFTPAKVSLLPDSLKPPKSDHRSQ